MSSLDPVMISLSPAGPSNVSEEERAVLAPPLNVMPFSGLTRPAEWSIVSESSPRPSETLMVETWEMANELGLPPPGRVNVVEGVPPFKVYCTSPPLSRSASWSGPDVPCSWKDRRACPWLSNWYKAATLRRLRHSSASYAGTTHRRGAENSPVPRRPRRLPFVDPRQREQLR